MTGSYDVHCYVAFIFANTRMISTWGQNTPECELTLYSTCVSATSAAADAIKIMASKSRKVATHEFEERTVRINTRGM